MRLLTALIAALALALTGCANSSGPAGSGGSAATGTLTGRVGITGGAVQPNGKSALNNAPAQDAKVTVTAADHRVYTATTNGSGQFSIALAAGRYSVRSDCSLPVGVTVAAGTTTVQDLHCDVP
jgi:hypothetical protein